MDCPLLLLNLGTVLILGCGFSVDVNRITTFQMQAESFGRSVAQTENKVLVGAPFQRVQVNETGKLYQCSYHTGTCKEIRIRRPSDAINMSLGLSLTTRHSQVLVCGPTVHRTCGKNRYVNGYCFLLGENLQQLRRFPETLPECTARSTDIVFLIDGSGSISSRDFVTMKTFVSEVIKRLSGRDTKFALMQFSDKFTEHFDFTAQDPADLIMDIEQLSGWTQTATAIRKVVTELFIPSKGSRKGSTKVLIVITDGMKLTDPLRYQDVIPNAEAAGIIRYAVGVGSAFSSDEAKKELADIASAPQAKHVFAVYGFDALKGIQDQLRDKIFSIEGTQSQNSSSFQMEMSQEGFSALLTPEGPVLGTVGAHDWSGGVLLYQNSSRDPQFINVSSSAKDMNNAYLGYSSQFVQRSGISGFVVGSPRHNHIGKVVLFERDSRSREWRQKMEAVGEQIGSYFGATLCAVDLDRDTNTDLVLVGAPMYYDGVTGGKVYVCQFKEEAFHCSTTLTGQVGHVFGRFGASMAEVGDITADGWTDVAIGAPMEDENLGALYIYQGRPMSINPRYTQRIEGLQFSGGLFYFGQSVSGGTDLTSDGLMDIAVGRQRQVLLLRSRPVLRVHVSIEFQPPVIPTSAVLCQRKGPKHGLQAASMAVVCFDVAKASQDVLGETISDLRYSLALESERTQSRASFQSETSPVLHAEFEIGQKRKCQDHWIELQICIDDTWTPITLRLNYTLVGRPIAEAQNLQPLLSEDSQRIYRAQLPFEKNCGKDLKCEDNLRTLFNFSGLGTLVVGLTPELTLTASIQNHGEDSYRTTLRFSYPAGISYRKVTLLEPSRKVENVKCKPSPVLEEQDSRNTTCNISHPILRSGAEAVFVATFDVSPKVDLGDTLRIMATANSDNGGSITKDMVHQAELPIKYAVYIIVTTTEESTKYVNFTPGQDEASKSVEHRYEVKNLLDRNLSVTVKFQIPIKVNGIQVWNVSRLIPSKPELVKCALEREISGSKDPKEESGERPLLGCFVASCKVILCDISLLKMGQPLEFRIQGDISFQWLSQTQQKKIILESSAEISYDEKKYYQNEGFVRWQVQTVVERIEAYNYLPVVAGSSIGGLLLLTLMMVALYKVGFFKRQYKQALSDAGAGDGHPDLQATEPSAHSKDNAG